MYLLGLDVGTSLIKAAIVSPRGEVVSFAQNECPLHHPQPDWNELDPDEVWAQVRNCIKTVLAKAPVRATEVTGLSLSVLGEAVMPVDSSGGWLYPAIEAWDKRGNAYKAQRELLLKKFGTTRLFQVTGLPLLPIATANKILWIRETLPSIYRKTAKFLCFEAYLIWRLTGQIATDHSLASRTMLFDVRRKIWSSEILTEIRIDPGLLPEPFPSGTAVGEVSREAAEETGLSKGTIVVTGGHDQSCGALGVGLVEEGPVMEAGGTVECIATITSEPRLSEEMLSKSHCSCCYVKDGMYITLGSFPAGGWTLKWYRDNLAGDEKQVAEREGISVYQVLDREAADSPVGAHRLLFLPHLAGSGTGQTPAMNPHSRGVLLGIGLTHRRSDVVRAILEGLTFELRQVLDSFEEMGLKVREMRSVGGGANSPFWLQLKADITRRRVIVPVNKEAAVMGAAILAGVGCKAYHDVDEGARKIFRESDVYTPEENRASVYDRYYSVYKKMYPTLLGIFDEINNL